MRNRDINQWPEMFAKPQGPPPPPQTGPVSWGGSDLIKVPLRCPAPLKANAKTSLQLEEGEKEGKKRLLILHHLLWLHNNRITVSCTLLLYKL